MQYCDWSYFLLFLPIVMLLYQVIPKKGRFLVLLIASYFFFYLLSGKLLIYLLVSTFSIHHFGLWIHDTKRREEEALKEALKEQKKAIRKNYEKKKKLILLLGIIIQLVMLASTKYLPFFTLNVNHLLDFLNVGFQIKEYRFLAPIGISFYTLQAISYLVDVYRGKVHVDSNLFRLALYMAFFPQIMEGPIARYEDTAKDLYKGERLHYQQICFGMQRIFYGLIKKIVIADRLNRVVQVIFNNYNDYNGGILFLGVVFYTIQLYMDFSGVIDIAIGSGEIFNVKIPENFRQPFFSKSISDFWARWHITLGTWFKDYIFYPISLSKVSKKLTSSLRKKLGNHFGPLLIGSFALLIVWLCNGLWHGSGYNYIFFGLYHFTFILMGNIAEPFVDKFYKKFKVDRNQPVIRVLQAVRTTIIVLFGELFFRAAGTKAGIAMFTKIIMDFNIQSIFSKKVLDLGLDVPDLIIIGITLLIVFFIGLLKEKGVSIRESIAKKPILVRWTLYYILILYALIFGAYGGSYAPIDPMYASF